MNAPDASQTFNECDLLMKGGITSGIVYPRLVERLARDYRLRHIGGTSAGAIAAAAAAAAELGRQGGACPDAFSRLGGLPTELGTETDGRSRLLHLFQPAARLRRLFEFGLGLLAWRGRANRAALAAAILFPPLSSGIFLLVAVLGAHLLAATPRTQSLAYALATCIPAALAAATWQYVAPRCRKPAPETEPDPDVPQPPAPYTPQPSDWLGILLFLATLAIAFLHVWLAGPFALALALIRTLVAATLAAVAVGAWTLWTSVRRMAVEIRDNHFGVCSGLTPEGSTQTALTDWLERYLAQLGGLAGDAPLCFTHLWHASAQAIQPSTASDCPRDARRIHLEMVTTALSQHTAYAIPFRANAGTFYFAPSEWKRLFPQNVVDWLVACGGTSGQRHPDTGEELVPLVRDGRLPVIVGVRMSLSFPVLLSAVPLFAADYTHRSEDRGGDRYPVKRVWFSDGGITSNLPLQAFDNLLPVRPVFTINLKEAHPCHPVATGLAAAPSRVSLPENNKQGRGRYWKPFDETGGLAVVRFLWSIVDTMQRWRDEILFPYAGYRDRIAQISLRDDEGGLHLAMTSSQIGDLAAAGHAAGEKLYRRFHPAAHGDGWANHQRLALLNLLGGIEILTCNMHKAPQQGDWRAAFTNSNLTKGTIKEATDLLRDLATIGARYDTPKTRLARHAGKPSPQLRMAPEL